MRDGRGPAAAERTLADSGPPYGTLDHTAHASAGGTRPALRRGLARRIAAHTPSLHVLCHRVGLPDGNSVRVIELSGWHGRPAPPCIWRAATAQPASLIAACRGRYSWTWTLIAFG